MMTEFIQIGTTVATQEDGVRLADTLVKQRLAACVQISEPVVSIYRWQGKVEQAMEYQLTIKTRSTLFAQVEALLKKEHPYDIPEIIAIPLVACSPAYCQWLDGELKNE